MNMEDKMVKLAVNGGINFGSKLTAKQLITLADYMDEDQELELTTFQQLYLDIPESRLEEAKLAFETAGLHWYPVGNYVKSLRTCNFCKGAEEEGMPVAAKLNERIKGKPVPFPIKVAYTGCPNACGEPLVNDIGIIKMKDAYDLFIGGRAKGKNAQIGHLFLESLQPEDLYQAVEKIIAVYAENGKKREYFAKFLKRYGIERLKEEIL
ncbi:nitrite reductase [Metabacillus idriensis]|nr:nitrite reductase [Metabacillus idriensis]MCM3597594.1 nitrite reductase [Metabacillus idriensis]